MCAPHCINGIFLQRAKFTVKMKYKWNARAVFTKGTIGNGTAQFLFPFIGITVTRSSLARTLHRNIAAGIPLGVIPRRVRASITPIKHRIAKRECCRTTSEGWSAGVCGAGGLNGEVKRNGNVIERLTRLFAGLLFFKREPREGMAFHRVCIHIIPSDNEVFYTGACKKRRLNSANN